MVITIILIVLNILFICVNTYLLMQLNNLLDALEDTFQDMSMLLEKYKVKGDNYNV